jgi:hypothetical protein
MQQPISKQPTDSSADLLVVLCLCSTELALRCTAVMLREGTYRPSSQHERTAAVQSWDHETMNWV